MASIEALKTLAANLSGEEDVVTLSIPAIGLTINNWKSYDISNDFMDATSSFSLEVADDNLQELAGKVQNGQKIALFVNGAIQATGYVDNIQFSYSTSGTTMRIQGRDALSPAADSSIDPKYIAQAGNTIGSIIKQLFAPYGFTDIKVDDSLNLKKMTKSVKVFTTDDNSNVVERLLDVKLNAKFKPHHGEGIYEYVQRLGKRYGFHVWCSADGTTLYAGRPNYNSEPVGTLNHTLSKDNSNNVLNGSMSIDWSTQPSAIIAEGHGAGGTFRKQSSKVILVNELLSDQSTVVPSIEKLKTNYKEAYIIPRRENIVRPKIVQPITSSFAKTVFLYDSMSYDKEQLKNYVISRMSEYQSRFFTMTYTVNRHSQNKLVWANNTLVNVNDELFQYKGLMWIKARRFTKDRSGGTKTELKLILPNTLQISADTRSNV